MQRLEVSGVVRLIYRSLGVKGLVNQSITEFILCLRTVLRMYTGERERIKIESIIISTQGAGYMCLNGRLCGPTF